MAPSFERINSSIDVDNFLYNEDIEGSIAHAEMLAKQKIISLNESHKIIKGLKKIKSEIKNKEFIFRDDLEDIHLNIETRLFELIGDVAGKLHTARSRNDQVATDLKLWMKKDQISILKKIKKLKEVLIKSAKKNIKTIIPGLTHFQSAQPISAGHYFLAYYEMFKRDTIRFNDGLNRIDENPLGSCALAGTQYKINRFQTSKKLGFKKPSRNSIDSVADRDFVLDFLSNASILSVHLSRISEEIVLFSSDLINFFRLGDEVVSSSSILPQKRNPDGAELVRAKASIVFSNLNSSLNLLKALPLTYSKDLQEDKQIVSNTSKSLNICLDCILDILNSLEINKKNAQSYLDNSFSNATELADWLVINLNYTFRNAHTMASRIVNYAEKKHKFLHNLKLSEYRNFDDRISKNLLNSLKIENAVNNKISYGGTSISEVSKMIEIAKKETLSEKI
tara:strand:+ start:497 stop:1849 length:1353 start_codon:yes stop_codon:yes gene_type:complete